MLKSLGKKKTKFFSLILASKKNKQNLNFVRVINKLRV